MATIFDYLEEVAHESIYDFPFGALDMLALSEITYLSYDGIVTDQPHPATEIRLLEAASQVPQEPNMLTTKNRIHLLQTLSQINRFKNIKLLNYVNDIDMDQQKQFAAMTYRLSLDTYLVVFRGTDDSIIGWKEDFHMTYMDHIPAQKTAVRYLQQIMASYPKARFILAGHSKGGNLATYAASFISPNLQDRIETIYSYDAPGLNKSLIQTPAYQNCVKKIRRYIPQGSIVGMMLETPEDTQIVSSTALSGISQHNTFTWQIHDREFITLDRINNDSLQTDQTFKAWVKAVPDEELKEFFDVFFGIILDAGIESIDDLASLESIRKLREIFRNIQNLEPEQQEMMNRLSRQLLDTRYQMWKDGRNEVGILGRLLGSDKDTNETSESKQEN